VILDALAATGLRSIRYYKEIPGVRKVIVNDMDEKAVEAAKRNVAFNGFGLDDISPQQGDANLAMLLSGKGGYDVIDLDPYGTAAPFIDAAVQSIADGGLLCVTCTDMATLSGQQPESCYAKYGSMPTRSKYLHEMALRILLNTLETCANRYKRHIVPVVSCGIDFYIRVFVRVFESPAEVKRSCMKAGYVLQSNRCPSFHIQPVAKNPKNNSYSGATAPTSGGSCAETGGSFKLGGPMWIEPLHDMEWVNAMLGDVQDHIAKCQGKKGAGGGGGGAAGKSAAPFDNGLANAKAANVFPPIQTKERLHGLLTAVSEELPDVPLYYTLPSLCETVHCVSPKMDQVRAALINAGYRVSAFHKEADAIKTDAPNQVVWDIIRCWVAEHPVHGKRKDADQSPGQLILAKAPELTANFSRPRGGGGGGSGARGGPSGFVGRSERPKAQRFPQNPEAHWGPKSRARHSAAPAAEKEGGEPASKKSKTGGEAQD
jgi:tRNA (guanine26-N2/guanine27-N2)-dimethyltransferase